MIFSLAQRTGYFVKEENLYNNHKIKYFFLDDNYIIFYTPNLSILERSIKNSLDTDSVSQKLKGKAKQYPLKQSQVMGLKTLQNIDNKSQHYNKTCFDLLISTGENQYMTLLMFSTEEEGIIHLYEFIRNYSKVVGQIQQQKSKQIQNKPTNSIQSQKTIQQQDSFKSTLEYYRITYEKQRVNDQKTKKSQKTMDIEEYKQKFLLIQQKMNEYMQFKDEKHYITQILKQKEEKKQEETNDKIELAQLIQLKDGSTFSGPTKGGKPHGEGKLFYKDGTSYVGSFRDGKWHGVGYFVNQDLDINHSEFIDGRPVAL